MLNWHECHESYLGSLDKFLEENRYCNETFRTLIFPDSVVKCKLVRMKSDGIGGLGTEISRPLSFSNYDSTSTKDGKIMALVKVELVIIFLQPLTFLPCLSDRLQISLPRESTKKLN